MRFCARERAFRLCFFPSSGRSRIFFPPPPGDAVARSVLGSRRTLTGQTLHCSFVPPIELSKDGCCCIIIAFGGLNCDGSTPCGGIAAAECSREKGSCSFTGQGGDTSRDGSQSFARSQKATPVKLNVRCVKEEPHCTACACRDRAQTHLPFDYSNF